jgi:predicted naringenin-chalcone synthase
MGEALFADGAFSVIFTVFVTSISQTVTKKSNIISKSTSIIITKTDKKMRVNGKGWHQTRVNATIVSHNQNLP